MDLMHHWQPCFWTVSAILIVLSTVVAKDAVSSVLVQYWLRVQTLWNRFLILGGWKRVPGTWQSTREPSCSWLLGEPLLFLSSRLASQAHLPLRASWSSGVGIFFSSAFSNLLVGIPLVGMCHRVVYMYACAVGKKPQKENVLVENDAWTRKQKANEKNNPCRSSKNMSKQTDSESSKNIDPGEILQVGLTDGRRPRCPLSLGNGQRPLPRKENIILCTVVCIELWTRTFRRRRKLPCRCMCRG